MCVCVRACERVGCMCHAAYIEIRAQLCRVDLFFHLDVSSGNSDKKTCVHWRFGGGEVVQPIRTLAAHPEDLCLAPSTHIIQCNLQPSVTLASGDLMSYMPL